MPNKSLTNFIRENLSHGYDAVSIRDHLIKSGYNSVDVDDAFNAVYQKKPEGKRINVWVLAFIFVVLLAIAGISYWFLFARDNQVQLPSTGPQQGCSNGIKDQQETGIDCGGPCKSCPVRTMPTQDPGNQVPVDENDEVIVQPPITLPEEETVPKPGEKPSWEILREIHDTALVDPEKAGKMCDDVEKAETRDSCHLDLAQITKHEGNCNFIQNENDKDGCFASVAQLAKDSSICAEVEYADLRDSCYMDFILNGDYALCDNIATDYYKNACTILRS